MKLATFNYQDQIRIGAVVEDYIVDSLVVLRYLKDMISFLERGDVALYEMQQLVSSGRHRISLSSVQLLSPIPRPRKYLGIGLNYADHIDETGLEKPREIFNIFYQAK
jgi:2-keto-4-pentenoate hydratase/2-oxohepta-3-ene-1,7-dioic acid hydratase in catechol pathway